MKALFKHSNGRLKTSRMALFVFIILLVCLSLTYKMGKSADKVLLKIEHVFEAQKYEEPLKEPAAQVAQVAGALEHPVPEKPLKIKQEQGKTLDKGKELVNLRILNLENVYDLFQMKAVVIKNGKPHTDLEDNSRIAKTSLSEFSSTCFIVSNPWGKWGDALKDAGFTKNDNIEVWYYTYEFVRNSIYARAQKAFAWSAAKLNLPEAHDPSKADVLGKVYAVNKAGGGAFGVFVPIQVDFQSRESFKIDPLACYKGEKDIQALNNAGLLRN